MASLETLEEIARRIETKLDDAIANLHSLTARVESIEKREISRDSDIGDIRRGVQAARMFNEKLKWRIGVPLAFVLLNITYQFVRDFFLH